jgi:hypothetical protein
MSALLAKKPTPPAGRPWISHAEHPFYLQLLDNDRFSGTIVKNHRTGEGQQVMSSTD